MQGIVNYLTYQKLKMATKKQASKVTLISAHAKKIYKKGSEKWTDAVRRAALELKKAGKI